MPEGARKREGFHVEVLNELIYLKFTLPLQNVFPNILQIYISNEVAQQDQEKNSCVTLTIHLKK